MKLALILPTVVFGLVACNNPESFDRASRSSQTSNYSEIDEEQLLPNENDENEVENALETLLATRKCRGCNLEEANLVATNLEGVDLGGANLQGANLTGANLVHANLALTNLQKANLTRADLTGANLSGASL